MFAIEFGIAYVAIFIPKHWSMFDSGCCNFQTETVVNVCKLMLVQDVAIRKMIRAQLSLVIWNVEYLSLGQVTSIAVAKFHMQLGSIEAK